MAKTTEPIDSNTISSEELLRRVPSAEHMQGEMQQAAAFVQTLHADQGVEAIEIIGRNLQGLPNPIRRIMRATFGTIVKIGNFCNAGGRIVFVDPPKPQDSSPADSETQT